MRIKKLRGHKRRWKSINKWRNNSLSFEVDYFNEYQRDYKELLINPWCDMVITNSTYPQPKGKTKLKMLEGLIDVFDFWNNELRKSEKEYSLYLWLYEERFTKSQVVCATGDFINYYDTTFYPNKAKNTFKSPITKLTPKLNKFNWTQCIDEDYYDQSDLGTVDQFSSFSEFNEHKKWFNNLLKGSNLCK